MSIWGVASPFPVPQVIAPTGDVTLTAGAEVLIATTTAMKAPAGADAYPYLDGVIALAIGVAAPTALVIAARFNGGADFATYTLPPAILVINTTILIPVSLFGANSGANFSGAGKVVEITGLATTNAATAKQVGTSIGVGLTQGPDA